jgi:hypothetical protein
VIGVVEVSTKAANIDTEYRLSVLVYGVASEPAAEAVPPDWPGVEKIGNDWAFNVPPLGGGFTAVTGIVPAEAISAAEIAAVPPVVPTMSVVRLLPFHSINEQGAQPVPLTLNRNAGSPATALDGTNEFGGVAIVGAGNAPGAANVNVEELEVTVELETVTFAVPWNAVSAAEIVAVSCVILTNAVGRDDPFQLTTSPFTKFVPVTVNVRPE